jgi:hypothetical protein
MCGGEILLECGGGGLPTRRRLTTCPTWLQTCPTKLPPWPFSLVAQSLQGIDSGGAAGWGQGGC